MLLIVGAVLDEAQQALLAAGVVRVAVGDAHQVVGLANVELRLVAAHLLQQHTDVEVAVVVDVEDAVAHPFHLSGIDVIAIRHLEGYGLVEEAPKPDGGADGLVACGQVGDGALVVAGRQSVERDEFAVEALVAKAGVIESSIVDDEPAVAVLVLVNVTELVVRLALERRIQVRVVIAAHVIQVVLAGHIDVGESAGRHALIDDGHALAGDAAADPYVADGELGVGEIPPVFGEVEQQPVLVVKVFVLPVAGGGHDGHLVGAQLFLQLLRVELQRRMQRFMRELFGVLRRDGVQVVVECLGLRRGTQEEVGHPELVVRAHVLRVARGVAEQLRGGLQMALAVVVVFPHVVVVIGIVQVRLALAHHVGHKCLVGVGVGLVDFVDEVIALVIAGGHHLLQVFFLQLESLLVIYGVPVVALHLLPAVVVQHAVDEPQRQHGGVGHRRGVLPVLVRPRQRPVEGARGVQVARVVEGHEVGVALVSGGLIDAHPVVVLVLHDVAHLVARQGVGVLARRLGQPQLHQSGHLLQGQVDGGQRVGVAAAVLVVSGAHQVAAVAEAGGAGGIDAECREQQDGRRVGLPDGAHGNAAHVGLRRVIDDADFRLVALRQHHVGSVDAGKVGNDRLQLVFLQRCLVVNGLGGVLTAVAIVLVVVLTGSDGEAEAANRCGYQREVKNLFHIHIYIIIVLQSFTSYFLHLTSYFLHLTSYILHLTSYFLLLTSYISILLRARESRSALPLATEGTQEPCPHGVLLVYRSTASVLEGDEGDDVLLNILFRSPLAEIVVDGPNSRSLVAVG